MCAVLNIDPITSHQTFLGKVLGLGDYYYKLALKATEVCLAGRSRNGGVTNVRDVIESLGRKGLKADEEDVVLAIGKLSILGGGFRVVKVDRESYIFSVPGVLDNDVPRVISLAQRSSDADVGCVTLEGLCRSEGWEEQRARRVLRGMVRDGICWLDKKDGRRSYWLWGVWWSTKNAGVALV